MIILMLAVTLVQYRNSSKVTKYSNQHDRRLLKIEAISYPRSRMWITYGNMVVTTNKQKKKLVYFIRKQMIKIRHTKMPSASSRKQNFLGITSSEFPHGCLTNPMNFQRCT